MPVHTPKETQVLPGKFSLEQNARQLRRQEIGRLTALLFAAIANGLRARPETLLSGNAAAATRLRGVSGTPA